MINHSFKRHVIVFGRFPLLFLAVAAEITGVEGGEEDEDMDEDDDNTGDEGTSG